MIEPEAKNTSGAILVLAFTLWLKILMPSYWSHRLIMSFQTASFHYAIKQGLDAIDHGKIVTFGLKPEYAETGYGYLKIVEDDKLSFKIVSEFVEKPDKIRAQSMIDAGDYLWNSGIFLFKASDMISAFEQHAKKTYKITKQAVEQGKTDLGFFRLDPELWSQLSNISIDYEMMEKVNNLVAISFEDGWSDLEAGMQYGAIVKGIKMVIQHLATLMLSIVKIHFLGQRTTISILSV